MAHVDNIAPDADAATLLTIFHDCLYVRLRAPNTIYRSADKRFAFVHFANDASLENAIAKDGTTLLGRSLKVTYAQLKKTRMKEINK